MSLLTDLLTTNKAAMAADNARQQQCKNISVTQFAGFQVSVGHCPGGWDNRMSELSSSFLLKATAAVTES